jgi:hypothetical protein
MRHVARRPSDRVRAALLWTLRPRSDSAKTGDNVHACFHRIAAELAGVQVATRHGHASTHRPRAGSECHAALTRRCRALGRRRVVSFAMVARG